MKIIPVTNWLNKIGKPNSLNDLPLIDYGLPNNCQFVLCETGDPILMFELISILPNEFNEYELIRLTGSIPIVRKRII